MFTDDEIQREYLGTVVERASHVIAKDPRDNVWRHPRNVALREVDNAKVALRDRGARLRRHEVA